MRDHTDDRDRAALARLCASTPPGFMASADRLFLDRISRWRVLRWWVRGDVRLRLVPRPGPRRRLPEVFVIPRDPVRQRLERRATHVDAVAQADGQPT